MTKRKFLTKLLVAGCTLCSAAALSLSFANANVKAGADDTLPSVTSTEKIEMMYGAQVRKESGVEGSQTALQQAKGIRFRMYINKEYYDGLTNPEVGVYVALESKATEAEMSAYETADEKSTWAFKVTDKTQLDELEAGDETQEAVYVLNAVVANPPEDNYNTQLIANGYVTADDTTTMAANPQKRSTAQVASLALVDGEGTTTDDPHGTLNHYVDTVVEKEGFDFANTSIATDKYKTATPDVGATLPENLTAKWESSNTAVATVGSDGTITRVGEGETTITATLGSASKSATLTIEKPYIFTATEDTASKITASGVTITYAESSTISGVTANGYEGNAATSAMTSGKAYNLAIDSYTETELTAISADYNYVSMWLAYDITENGADGAQPYYASLYKNADNYVGKITADDANNAVWVQYMIPMETYITFAAEQTSICLIRFDYAVTGTFYFGDISFEFVAPTILTVTEATAANIAAGGVTGEYVSGSTLNFEKNGYEGDATVITHSWNGSTNYSFTNFDATKFNSYKEKYTHVTLWMAYDHNTENVPYSTGTTLATKGGYRWSSLTSDNVRSWFKISVKISDFEALVASDSIVLLRICCDTSDALTNNLRFYFGDIIFETITE